MQGDETDEVTAERSINRAITLSNKVKLKYVGIENAVEYTCEKFHVKNAKELEQNWEYYKEAVKEKKKYQQTSEDLDYFNGKLIRQLSSYRFYDARKWISQANAIVDSREMVEIKHEMIGRRQMLRSQIEYNTKTMAEQKAEAEVLLPKAGDMRPQVEEILASVEKLVASE
jgi:neutral trehalase